jgi:hypothetical protein
MNRTQLIPKTITGALEAWAKEQHGPVKVYDFGDGVTVMPIPSFDGKETTYATSSICYLYIEGDGPLPLLADQPEQKPTRIDGMDFYGNGWKFFGLEISRLATPSILREALENAKEKLLAAR